MLDKPTAYFVKQDIIDELGKIAKVLERKMNDNKQFLNKRSGKTARLVEFIRDKGTCQVHDLNTALYYAASKTKLTDTGNHLEYEWNLFVKKKGFLDLFKAFKNDKQRHDKRDQRGHEHAEDFCLSENASEVESVLGGGGGSSLMGFDKISKRIIGYDLISRGLKSYQINYFKILFIIHS